MKETISATILFADLMNSTEFAKNLSLVEYDEMLVNFQSTMYEIISDHLDSYGYAGEGADAEWSIVGDEVRVFLYSGNLRYDIRNALLIAMKMKLGWIASAFNQKVLHEHRPVSQIGVGVNWGKVIRDVRPWRCGPYRAEPNIEGYAINLTKRIESASRAGAVSKIMVGERVYETCRRNDRINVIFSRPQKYAFKGLGQEIRVYELVCFVNFENLYSMPKTMQENLLEKMEKAASLCSQELPWLCTVLMRSYISRIAAGSDKHIELKAVEFGRQVLNDLEYKPVLCNMLGWIYAYGKYVHNNETALHYFEHCLEMEPQNQSALLHRARILDKMGAPMARNAYQQILIQNMRHPEAKRKIEQFAS